MKKILVLSLFIVGLIASAQNSEIEKNLSRKWKLDLDDMRPIMEKIIKEDNRYSGLDDQNKKIALDTALEQLVAISITYKEDGTYLSVNSKETSSGIWNTNEKGTLLITKSSDKPKKEFRIVELNTNKLHLITENNMELVFKPVKE